MVTQYDLYKCRLNIDFILDCTEIVLNRPNRSKREMISDILRTIEINGATISEIQFKTYISYQHLKKYLTYLVQNELIIYTKAEKRFRITQRGFHALDTYIKNG